MSVIDVDRSIGAIDDLQLQDLTLGVDLTPAVGTTAQSLDQGVMIVGMATKTTRGDTMSVKTGVDREDAKDIVMNLGEGEKAHTLDPILVLLVDDMDTYTILLRLVCLVLKRS
jgi:CheY-specific phosphatase CheX